MYEKISGNSEIFPLKLNIYGGNGGDIGAPSLNFQNTYFDIDILPK